MGYGALWILSVVFGVPSVPAVSWVTPISLTCGSDDDRANLMWKRYLEREDSKIVGMARAAQRGHPGTPVGAGSGENSDAVEGGAHTWVVPWGRCAASVRGVGGGGWAKGWEETESQAASQGPTWLFLLPFASP